MITSILTVGVQVMIAARFGIATYKMINNGLKKRSEKKINATIKE